MNNWHISNKSKTSKSTEKNVTHSTASSTQLSSGNIQYQWLQQAELDVVDAFLDQLEETPATEPATPAVQVEKQSKSSKKRKNNQPWF